MTNDFVVVYKSTPRYFLLYIQFSSNLMVQSEVDTRTFTKESGLFDIGLRQGPWYSRTCLTLLWVSTMGRLLKLDQLSRKPRQSVTRIGISQKTICSQLFTILRYPVKAGNGWANDIFPKAANAIVTKLCFLTIKHRHCHQHFWNWGVFKEFVISVSFFFRKNFYIYRVSQNSCQ